MGNTCIKDYLKSKPFSSKEKQVIKPFLERENGVTGENNLPDVVKENVYVALRDVSGVDDDHLSFGKGDQVELLDKQEIVWHGRSLVTQKEGFFFPDVVEPYDLKECPWYFGSMKRMRAEQLLLRVGVPGTFMVRLSETDPTDYSLSLRDTDSIKHYRIKKIEKGGYYIRDKCKFADLKVLVKHYERSADGLARRLESPCPPPSPDTEFSHSDQWETARERVKLIKELGVGHFGKVWEGVWNETIKVAVKTLKTSCTEGDSSKSLKTSSTEGEVESNTTNTDTKRDDFLAEARVMKKLSHPRLVRLYAMCSLDEPVYIILELMTKGNLIKFLPSKEGKKLSHDHLLVMSAEIADGMSFLETHKFLHRDLAARNILVSENYSVKIADFGLSTQLVVPGQEYVEENEHFKVATKWAAPEVNSQRRFSMKSDVWSFGIVLYEIASRGGAPPDQVDSVKEMQPQGFPDRFYETMIKCWQVEPATRPTFEQLKRELSGD